MNLLGDRLGKASDISLGGRFGKGKGHSGRLGKRT